MALTNGLEAIKVLLNCVQADSSQVAHVIIEEKQNTAKLKKLTVSELAPDVIVLITRERYVIFHTDSKNAKNYGVKSKTRFSPNDANAPSSPKKFCVRNGDTVRFSEFF